MDNITFSNESELEELYKRYDEIINITLINIYSMSKTKGEIVLSPINRKNQNHLYLLRVALLAKDIFNFPLKIKSGFWNWLCLNWRMRKLSRRIPMADEFEDSIDVDKLLDFMKKALTEQMGEDFEFANIYNAFYRKELD